MMMLPQLLFNLKQHRAISSCKRFPQKRNICHNFNKIISSKGSEGSAQLTDTNFWDAQYSLKKDVEWYIPQKQAANFVHDIILAKQMLKRNKYNILLEIGCGSSPLIVPLITRLADSDYLTTGIATDVSSTCIANLKKQYHDMFPTKFRSREEPGRLSFLCPGVLASTLDITYIKDYIDYQLQYFPVRFPSAYSNDFYNKERLAEIRTNVIIIDKGCLDAFIWDSKSKCLENVLNASQGIVSLSGEDPDIRLDYFQQHFGQRFSVHFLNDKSNIFGYSFVNG